MNAFSTMLFALSLFVSFSSPKQSQSPSAEQSALYQEISAADTQLFSAANACDLAKLGAMVDDDLEFYHDQAGLMTGKQKFLDAVKNNTCGTMIRELVPGTLEVYPIKDFGAIEVAVHRFHHPGHEKEWPGAKALGMTRFLDPGADEWAVGEAKFLHIWRKDKTGWKLTRVVSYGHHGL